MEMTALKNGTTAPQSAVVSTIMSLNMLWKEGLMGMCAVIELVERCKNPQHSIDSVSEQTLRKLALIQSDGGIHEIIKNVALSAAEGEGHHMVLTSPIKLSDDDLALKKKVEETTDNLLGVHMAMMQLAQILSRNQIEAFCDNTRNGSDLWDDFKAARDASGNEDFEFKDYTRQVLSTTAHPMS